MDNTGSQTAEDSTNAFLTHNHLHTLENAFLRIKHLLACFHQVEGSDGGRSHHAADRGRDDVLENGGDVKGGRKVTEMLVRRPVDRGKADVANDHWAETMIKRQETLRSSFSKDILQELFQRLTSARR